VSDPNDGTQIIRYANHLPIFYASHSPETFSSTLKMHQIQCQL